MLTHDVASYLVVRRAAGFTLKSEGSLLQSFATLSDASGKHHVCSEIAIQWAGSAQSLAQRARRLGQVIRFARYIRAEDQRHEVPPARSLAARSGRDLSLISSPTTTSVDSSKRHPSSVFAMASVGIPTARSSPCWHVLDFACQRPARLCFQDISSDGLVIRSSKFRKSRLVPLHETAQVGLERYLQRRRSYAPCGDHLFVSLRRRPLLLQDTETAFHAAIEKIGLLRGPKPPRPTIHSLRHTFAVRALETCPDGRDRITRHMLALSTYLGHGKVADTCWYLEATPDLMRNIADSCQSFFTGGQR